MFSNSLILKNVFKRIFTVLCSGTVLLFSGMVSGQEVQNQASDVNASTAPIPYVYNQYPDWQVGMKPGFLPDPDGGYVYAHPTCWDNVLGPGDWRFNAWIDQGVTYGDKRTPRTNAPQVYNDMNNEYQMNQAYFALERRIKEDCQWSLGGRIDMLYGTDYYYTQAYGLEARNVGYMTTLDGDAINGVNRWNDTGSRHLAQDVARYGLSLPQFYAEAYIPFWYGVKVKMGHFYSGMSLESPMAMENFFYSHSYTSYYGVPTTLTGMLMTMKLGGNLEFLLGFNEGWNRFEVKEGGALSMMTGFQWKNDCDNIRLKFLVNSGKETWSYEDPESVKLNYLYKNYGVTVLSTQFEWQISQRLGTSLEYVYGKDDKGTAPVNNNCKSSDWMGIVNNWFYHCSDEVTLGLRAEWFRDNPQCGRIVYSDMFENQSSYTVFDISVGLNWKPCAWFTLRPECRWDSANLDAEPGYKFFGDKNSQFTFGMDMLLNF